MDFQIVYDALVKIITDIINFVPLLISGLIILGVGYLVARVLRWLVLFVLKKLKFDPLIEGTGITGSIRGLGVKTPLSEMIAQTIYFLLLLSFLITATRIMQLEAVARLLEQLLDFFPKVIAATIVFLLGGIVAKFAGDTVKSFSKGGGILYGDRLASVVQYIISLFVVVIALGVLGLDTALLVTAITIMLAAVGLGLGLALGLGMRTVVHHILAGYYIRQRLRVGQEIEFNQFSGQVSGIGTVNTSVAAADGAVVIPNSMLLESVVQTRTPPEAPPSV